MIPAVDPAPSSSADKLSVGLGVCAAIALAAAVLIGATGGFSASLGALRITARDPFRAYDVGVLLVCAVLWRIDRRGGDRTIADAAGAWAAAAVSLAAAIVAVRYGAFVAGSADAYGYISEALLWTQGQLHVAEPLTRLVPSLGAAVAPVGFRLARNGADLVPVYPPGLPLAMAVAIKVAGLRAVFFVVPFFTIVAVGATYAIGARLGGRAAGLMAAALLACSPIFLLQSMQPMSDVPAAALWLLAIALAMVPDGGWRAAASGLAVSAALLVRPNLAPLAAVVALVVAAAPFRRRRLALFALAAAPGPIAVAALNAHLYGSPLTSGYGTNASLFSLASIAVNLKRYPVWLMQVQTPAVLLALAAPFVATRRDSPQARGMAALLLIFVAVLTACYLIYIPFDNWAFLRFLLPGIGLLLILASAAFVGLVRYAPAVARRALLVGCGALLCGHYVQRASALNVFHDAESQRRYLAVARYADTALPPRAVVVSLVESGSLRFYGHRKTLRWDAIAPEEFDRSIDTLFANGYEPYILVEGSERAAFDARFGRTRYGALDWPPLAVYQGYERVLLYAARDRERRRAGSAATTVTIQP